MALPGLHVGYLSSSQSALPLDARLPLRNASIRPCKDSDAPPSTCAICFESLAPSSPVCSSSPEPSFESGVEHEKPISIIKCGHVFGENCLKTWMETSNTCPMCRVEFFRKTSACKCERAGPYYALSVFSRFQRPAVLSQSFHDRYESGDAEVDADVDEYFRMDIDGSEDADMDADIDFDAGLGIGEGVDVQDVVNVGEDVEVVDVALGVYDVVDGYYGEDTVEVEEVVTWPEAFGERVIYA